MELSILLKPVRSSTSMKLVHHRLPAPPPSPFAGIRYTDTHVKCLDQEHNTQRPGPGSNQDHSIRQPSYWPFGHRPRLPSILTKKQKIASQGTHSDTKTKLIPSTVLQAGSPLDHPREWWSRENESASEARRQRTKTASFAQLRQSRAWLKRGLARREHRTFIGPLLYSSDLPPVSDGPSLTGAFPEGSLTAPWLDVPWHLVLVQLHKVSRLQTDTRVRCWVVSQKGGETYQWLL